MTGLSPFFGPEGFDSTKHPPRRQTQDRRAGLHECLDQFRAAIKGAGLTPPETIEPDGRLHRFASNGKHGDDGGWYVLHGDGLPCGAFGCWRSGVTEKWQANIGRRLSSEEMRQHRERTDTIEQQRKAAEAARKQRSREKAAEIWQSARPAPDDHVYLLEKRIRAHGLRVHDGSLVVPVRDRNELHSLQFIAGDGGKRFLPGGRVSGCYYVIGEPDGVLCIAEGFATGASIHEATGHAVAVAFNAGNLKPTAEALRATFPDARLIVCADDDVHTDGNPGLKKAREAADAVGAMLATPEFVDHRPARATDFNDLHRHAGLDAVRSCIERAAKAATAQQGSSRRLCLKRARDIKTRLDALWRVARLLPRSGLAVIYGASGSGKTFITLDLGAHVAIGRDWCGRRCKPGVVVYIACENPASAENRIATWIANNPGSADAPLFVLPASINLYGTTKDLDELLELLAELVRAEGEIAMVIVDTLARAMPGAEENSASDMGAVIGACDAIRERFDTLVALVHHSGKNEDLGARGSSALRAAVDAEIKISVNGSLHTAEVQKLRDGPIGTTFSFKLDPVVLGYDEDGEAVTTCIVRDREETTGRVTPTKDQLAPLDRLAFNELHDMLGDPKFRKVAPTACIDAGAAIGQYAIRRDDWRQRFYARRGVGPEATKDEKAAAKKALQRAVENLQHKHHRIQCFEDFVWLAPTRGQGDKGDIGGQLSPEMGDKGDTHLKCVPLSLPPESPREADVDVAPFVAKPKEGAFRGGNP